MDSIAPIITLDESKIDFIFPKSLFVLYLTASITPSPGSTMASDFTSRYTPKAMIKVLIIQIIHWDRYVFGVMIGFNMYRLKSMK